MGVLESLSLCVVLLLALYGCAQATFRIVQNILRPHIPRVALLLTVTDQEDLEQQIRFAQCLSREWRIPIQVETQQFNEDAQWIISVLLDEKYG